MDFSNFMIAFSAGALEAFILYLYIMNIKGN